MVSMTRKVVACGRSGDSVSPATRQRANWAASKEKPRTSSMIPLVRSSMTPLLRFTSRIVEPAA